MAFKNFVVLLLSLCCPLYFFNEIMGANAKRCPTPRGEPGKCIPILQCRSLLILSVKAHRTHKETRLLEHSRCGAYNFSYKVCCPQEKIERIQRRREYKHRRILPTREECGISALSNRIFGGEESDIGEYPWTALLLNTNKSDEINYYIKCAGSLINKYYVITAAHCATSSGSFVAAVRLGEWNMEEKDDCDEYGCAPAHQDIDINKIIIHTQYNEASLENDVALLRMSVGVEYTEFIRPICLPLDVSQYGKRYEKQLAHITGWGRTKYASYSPIKLKATVKIMPTFHRSGHYYCGKVRISNTKFCASGTGQDSCSGDSGGPLMITEELNGKMNWYLIGIISYSNLNNTCGTKDSIGIYARVGSFIDWIQYAINT